jgi:cytochrome P450
MIKRMDAFADIFTPTPLTPEESTKCEEACIWYYSFFESVLFERLEHSSSTPLIRRLQLEHTQGTISTEAAVSLIHSLVTAGYQTTAHTICAGIVAICESQLDPTRRSQVFEDATIFEIARWDPAAHYGANRTTQHRVAIGDHEFEAGTSFLPCLGSANRDPTVFERPSEFLFGRRNSRNGVAFGGGRHVCIGQPLGAEEVAQALRKLFAAFPNIKVLRRPTRRHHVVFPIYKNLEVNLLGCR